MLDAKLDRVVSHVFAVILLAGVTSSAGTGKEPHDPQDSMSLRGVVITTPDTLSTRLPSRQNPEHCSSAVDAQLQVSQGHPWSPPFGLDRVGSYPVVLVQSPDQPPLGQKYSVVSYSHGRELERKLVSFERKTDYVSGRSQKGSSPYFGVAHLTSIPDEISVNAECISNGRITELLRQEVAWSNLEVDAAAHPTPLINPVDLGTILVPHNTLLLGRGQRAQLEIAAISRKSALGKVRVEAWFDKGEVIATTISLVPSRRATATLELAPSLTRDTSALHVRLTSKGHELWRKEIPTMVVRQLPDRRKFGAMETKLRYDAPIPAHDPKTGTAILSLDYDSGWDPELNDIVVFLPNGARFVFWRGASYVPVWVSAHNTAASYQWAENLSIPVHHPDGSVDLPEPLFDSELRYGRVRIVQSTASRIHVRWTYQLTDNEYNVWGDYAAEDYYFYPDGFGTRVVSIVSKPGTPYQLTEFIILTPQGAPPLEVIPKHIADVLFTDGDKQAVTFPLPPRKNASDGSLQFVDHSENSSAVYRLYVHKNDSASAIYFNPSDLGTPVGYPPFYDQGQLVTPAYWGSHWPLRRGKWTHWTIDDGILTSPAHNSIAGWLNLPKPDLAGEYVMLDAKGRSENLALQRWVALIGMTDLPDSSMLHWAQSFSTLPSIEVKGARIDIPSYAPDRRAIRLIVESPSIEIALKPTTKTVNPVFELGDAPNNLDTVTLNGRRLLPDEFAWDGATLWVKALIDKDGATIRARFQR